MRLKLQLNYFKNLCFALLLGMSVSSVAEAGKLDSRIFKFQEKIAKNGKANAQFKLAYLYETGRGTKKDISKAKEWYKKAALQNFKAANHRLVYIDATTSGFKAKHKSWFKTVINDANKGDDNTQFLLAYMYEKGIGVKPDLDKARDYYQKASAKRNADAESRLFGIVQKINADANKKRQAAEIAEKQAEAKRLQARKEAEAEKKKQQARKQKQLQLNAEKERKQLAAARQKAAAEKRKHAEQKNQLAKKQAEAKKLRPSAESSKTVVTAKNQEEVFESDLCTGAAARFRTQCN